MWIRTTNGSLLNIDRITTIRFDGSATIATVGPATVIIAETDKTDYILATVNAGMRGCDFYGD